MKMQALYHCYHLWDCCLVCMPYKLNALWRTTLFSSFLHFLTPSNKERFRKNMLQAVNLFYSSDPFPQPDFCLPQRIFLEPEKFNRLNHKINRGKHMPRTGVHAFGVLRQGHPQTLCQISEEILCVYSPITEIKSFNNSQRQQTNELINSYLNLELHISYRFQ